MNKFVNGISALGCGAAIALLVSELSKEENITKIKARLNDIFGAKNADDVEYVDDNVNINIMTRTMDEVSMSTDIKLVCIPEYAKHLYDYMISNMKSYGFVTIADVIETKWLDEDTIKTIKEHFTLDECETYGWDKDECHHLNQKAGTNYVLASYPIELDVLNTMEYPVTEKVYVDTDILESQERHAQVKANKSCTSTMEAYQKWCELEKARVDTDVLRLTSDEQEELTTSREVDAYKVLADIAEKMEEDGFVSVATLMQVIYDVDKNFYKNMEPFADRFANLNANYDEDTLINYGWTSMTYFDVFKIPNIESFMLTSTSPHNIALLVEEWTKKSRKEFEEETKAE